jgi:hypothetical protein
LGAGVRQRGHVFHVRRTLIRHPRDQRRPIVDRGTVAEKLRTEREKVSAVQNAHARSQAARLGFLSGIRRRILAGAGRFVGNPVVLIEPRTEIDEPTAIAAEGSVRRCRRPLHGSPAGGTFNGRDHPNPRKYLNQAQQVNINGTSTSTCAGRLVASSQFKNRMVQRCWLPLISGNSPRSGVRVTRTN